MKIVECNNKEFEYYGRTLRVCTTIDYLIVYAATHTKKEKKIKLRQDKCTVEVHIKQSVVANQFQTIIVDQREQIRLQVQKFHFGQQFIQGNNSAITLAEC